MGISPTLNIPQARFLAMQHKFKAYVAGFGSGKTWVGCGGICKGMWEHPKINQGYFAPTYPQIRDIFYLLKPRILNGSRVSQLKGRIRFWVPSVAVYSARVKSTWLICSLTKASGSAWNVLSSYQVLEPGNYHFLHALASAGAFLWARPDKIPRGNYVNSKHASEILRT